MDMKLFEEGIPEERTGGLTLEAYVSIASRQKRRESFYRALTVTFVCAAIFAAVSAYAAVRTVNNGGSVPSGAVFESPETVRAMLERFFMISCVPAVCFASAFSPLCRAVCALCTSLCGAACGAAIVKAVLSGAENALGVALSAALMVVLTATSAIYSAVCAGFRVCLVRYGVTEEDKNSLFLMLMTAAFILLVTCSLTLLIPALMKIIAF